jgi:TolB-like protein/DNA-binding winged helix-turn-helix (wHTH) protein/Tfp pilus assembly protein PilF
MEPERIRRFGVFEFDVVSLELRRAGRLTRFAPQPARALASLLRRPGEIVTREELAKDVWGGETFVDFDQGLNFCIRQIRTALGDTADSPRYIETIPRRGYRFVAPVEVLHPSAEADRAAEPVVVAAMQPAGRRVLTPALAAGLFIVGAAIGYGVWTRVRERQPADTTTIAVLPFDDLTGGQTYFGDGISEELAAQLGRTDPALTVIGRTSMRPFRDSPKTAADIGREVGAAHLVDGTVRRSGNRVRVTAELIRASDQSRVWSDTYEADATEILTVQQQMGLAIARQVLARIGPAAGGHATRVDPAVYDLYLQGRFYWNRRGGDAMNRARQKFAETVSRDATFARGYAGLGDCTLPNGQFREALAFAEQALALDPRLAEAHVTKAHALLHLFRWKDAEAAFQDGIAIDPSLPEARYFYAEFLVSQGRAAEAITQSEQALVVDPLSAITTHAAGVVRYYAGDNDGARVLLRRARELDPAHTWTDVRLALVDERQRAFADAIAAFERLGRPLRGAYAFARGGRPDDARRSIAATLSTGTGAGASYDLSGAYAGLGEYDEAMKWLRLAVQSRAYDAIYTAVDPRLAPLRTRADFRALLAEAGWPASMTPASFARHGTERVP